MIITVSQLIIGFCTLCFIIFHLYSVYKYQGKFNSIKIRIIDINITWMILNNFNSYNKWWQLFVKNPNLVNEVQVLEKYKNIVLKIIVNTPVSEAWTFYFNEDKSSGNYYLIVKTQKLTTSNLADFLNKYIRNNIALYKFKSSFYKASKSLVRSLPSQ